MKHCLTSVTLATYSNLYTNANIVYHLHTRKTSPILFGYFYKVTVSTRSQSSRLEVAFDNYCRKQHRSYPNYFYTFSGVVLFWNTDIVWLQEWKDRLVFYLRKRNLILSKKNYTNNSRCKGTGAVKEKEKDRICGRFLSRNMHMGDHRPACCYHGSMDTMYSQPRYISPY